jgi:hypothetical protein
MLCTQVKILFVFCSKIEANDIISGNFDSEKVYVRFFIKKDILHDKTYQKILG